MRQGLYIDALRGMDGTGLATVNRKGDVTVLKKALPANDFLELKRVDDLLDKNDNLVYIGHNRAATRGGITNNNSHPFTHGHITMVHNGSLRTTHQLIDSSKFSVDSDNIAYSLSVGGVDETLVKLNGAFALVWYDSKTRLVNMVRNNERPLSFATLKNLNGIIYASEADMLEYVAGRTGVGIEDIYDVPEEYLLSFDPNSKSIGDFSERKVKFRSFHNGNVYYPNKPNRDKGKGDSSKKDPAPKERDTLMNSRFKEIGIGRGEVIDIILYTFTPFKNSSNNMGVWEGCCIGDNYCSVVSYGGFKDQFDISEEYKATVMGITSDAVEGFPVNPYTDYKILVDCKSIKTKEEYSETTLLLKEDNENDAPFQSDIISLPPFEEENKVEFLYIRGPNGIDIPRKSWEILVAKGCAYCGGNILSHEADFVEWAGEYGDDPICPDCSHITSHQKSPKH